jgi:primase-polymerase (primpol)-like protein
VDDYVGHECALVEQIPGYRERSPGGNGIKVIGRSPRIGGQIDFAHDPPTFTTWSASRFFAVTGQRASGDPTADLSPFIDEWFPSPAPLGAGRGDGGYTLAAERTDDDLMVAMIAGDSNGDHVLALWRGDTSSYGHDHSRADLALCCHLAWWTNFDADRIDRLFRQSGLYRPKWDRPSYRRATLTKALSGGRAPDAGMPGPDLKVTAAELDRDWTGTF